MDVCFYFKNDSEDYFFRLEVCDMRKDELGREDNWLFCKDYMNVNDIVKDINYYSHQIPHFERTEKMDIAVPEKWKVSKKFLNEKMLRDHDECLFLATYKEYFIDISCNIGNKQNGVPSFSMTVTKPLGPPEYHSDVLFEKTAEDYFEFEKDLNDWLNKDYN